MAICRRYNSSATQKNHCSSIYSLCSLCMLSKRNQSSTLAIMIILTLPRGIYMCQKPRVIFFKSEINKPFWENTECILDTGEREKHFERKGCPYCKLTLLVFLKVGFKGFMSTAVMVFSANCQGIWLLDLAKIQSNQSAHRKWFQAFALLLE